MVTVRKELLIKKLSEHAGHQNNPPMAAASPTDFDTFSTCWQVQGPLSCGALHACSCPSPFVVSSMSGLPVGDELTLADPPDVEHALFS